MSDLMITLGHNSSVALLEDMDVVAIEEERVSGVKSDSSFPAGALRAFDMMPADPADVTDVFVTHWFDRFGDLALSHSDKYWDVQKFRELGVSDHAHVHTHTPELTHHDCHAWGAVDLVEQISLASPPEGACVLVVDGFGNFGECLSAYEWRYGSLRLLRRVYGYDHSVGLMYQFATSLVGMKENQDEYKMLGYMNRVARDEVEALVARGRRLGEAVAAGWARSEKPNFRGVHDRRIDVARLKASKAFWQARITKALDGFPFTRPNVALVVQTALEEAVYRFWIDAGVARRHLIVSGGVFLNVRLNDVLSQSALETFHAHPLAGDQGGALGMRRAINGRQMLDYESLALGRRPCENARRLDGFSELQNFRVVERANAAPVIADLLNQDVLVNVFRGGMEFGPRALCNTSTLALPTIENVSDINLLNRRDTVMPMAPVMSRATFQELFPSYDRKLVGSEMYMITACSTRGDVADKIKLTMGGACHPDPIVADKVSCRPQVSPDVLMDQVLGRVEAAPCLINTSLNYHGEPIVYTLEQLVRLHRRWQAGQRKFTTIVVEED